MEKKGKGGGSVGERPQNYTDCVIIVKTGTQKSKIPEEEGGGAGKVSTKICDPGIGPGANVHSWRWEEGFQGGGGEGWQPQTDREKYAGAKKN